MNQPALLTTRTKLPELISAGGELAFCHLLEFFAANSAIPQTAS